MTGRAIIYGRLGCVRDSLARKSKRETVTSTIAARVPRHPGRTINFLSVSPISAAIHIVIFSPIRRGRDGASFVATRASSAVIIARRCTIARSHTRFDCRKKASHLGLINTGKYSFPLRRICKILEQRESSQLRSARKILFLY